MSFKGSSETTRENIFLSIHKPNHKYPLNNNQYGYYIAGLIDGDGYISRKLDQNKIVICFNKKDISLAYLLKSFLNNGKVNSIDNSVNLVITNKIALTKISYLIHNKLKITSKIERLNSLILKLNIDLPPSIRNNENLLDNHYLSGLIDSDGCFTIRIINRSSRGREEVRLYLRIELNIKDKVIIDELKTTLGGSISIRKHINKLSESYSYGYNSVSFTNMLKILKYLDKYSLNSKYLEYTYIRKAYLIIQDKKHLTEEGINKLKEYRDSISELKKTKEKYMI